MAWLALDIDGTELIYDFREKAEASEKSYYQFIRLPSGSIEKLIGRKLTKKDMPVELTIKD